MRRASIAAATASASRVSRTSCTRTIQAPRRTASTFAAAVATARARSASPMIAPRNRLRDTPITTGGPTAAIASRCRRSERLCSPVFPNPMPGSMQIASCEMPA